ncbi:TRAP-type C4-dicarboxylate transport system substrate-binding protein [Rhodoligotrophos appendicifer]|uniref:TRAP transporter substrate-binding protein n=1 Tax=Rhodoligotrophos appendicifer TaxID=987056 RepID=UPI00117F00F2|nr:TRAP transporter substrate-binding protein DctP [Rhodoligotrophos appendicifer]
MNIKALALTLPLMLPVGMASAQEMTLRLADSLPASHVITRAVGKPFMDRVTELTNGQVKFEHYPAEQLGKARDILSAVQTGLTDIGYVIPSYVSEKMPLSAVAELPGGYPNACAGSAALNALTKEGGLLDQREFAPNKIKVLAAVVLPPYQAAFSGRAPVKTLADVKGLKIRSNPGPMELSIKALGGVPVRMTPPEIFDSLSKGTIDGLLLPYASIKSYGLDQDVKTVTQGANFGSVTITYSISDKKWKSLPENVQKAMLQAGEEVSKSGCAMFDEEEARLAGEFKEKGMVLLDFNAMEGDELSATFAKLGDEWAEILEKRRIPAKEVLDEFREQVAIAVKEEGGKAD